MEVPVYIHVLEDTQLRTILVALNMAEAIQGQTRPLGGSGGNFTLISTSRGSLVTTEVERPWIQIPEGISFLRER
jgi:hypothetical protein